MTPDALPPDALPPDAMTPALPATAALLNPQDSAERQREKLLIIADALMRRVEQGHDPSSAAYAQFERAALLEEQVRLRTQDLEKALDLLNDANAQLARASTTADDARRTLTDALETLPDGFGLFDAADRLVLSNSRFGAVLADIRPQLVPGLDFAAYVDLISRAQALVLPPDATAQDWAVQRLLRHRDASSVFTVELTGDRWMQVSEHRTPSGGTVVMQTDITAILRAERTERGKLLDDQSQLVRATLDHIDQGVAIFDAHGQLMGWNHRLAELVALGRGHFRRGVRIGDLMEQIAPRLADPGLAAPLLRWVAEPSPRPPLRFEWRRNGGGSDTLAAGQVLDGNAQTMPDGGFVVSLSDVTRERRAIEALERANETLEARVSARTLALNEALARTERANATRSRFVAAASHDLLQPLSAAKLFLASALDTDLTAPARRALVKTDQALESVEALVQALLDISRLESGKLAVDPRPVPLGPLLQRLAVEFEPLAQAKGLELRLRGTQATVLSDPLWLRRMLQNLMSNALRYTYRGGVLVGVRPGPMGLRIDVADTGVGIAAQDADTVFEEFRRLGQASAFSPDPAPDASLGPGLGLGLSIVDRAARLLGHGVTLRSNPGRGSRFSIHIAAPGGASAPPAGQGQDLDPVALVISAAPPQRRVLCATLDTIGYEVFDTATTAEALALMADTDLTPDLVLIEAPPATARMALDEAHSLHRALPATPLYLLCATRDDAVIARARTQGLTLLTPPLHPGHLRARVNPT